MEKKKYGYLYFALIIISIFIALIIIVGGIVLKTKKDEPQQWVLHSYGNNVALYNGDEVVEVYGSIILDNLPDEDKKQLENGIAFMTKNEAVKAIEDYDG